MMQEKSLNQTKDHREPPVDRLARLLWEQCDWVATIGLVAAIMMLFKLVCIISL
jgi:hypothetical protein